MSRSGVASFPCSPHRCRWTGCRGIGHQFRGRVSSLLPERPQPELARPREIPTDPIAPWPHGNVVDGISTGTRRFVNNFHVSEDRLADWTEERVGVRADLERTTECKRREALEDRSPSGALVSVAESYNETVSRQIEEIGWLYLNMDLTWLKLPRTISPVPVLYLALPLGTFAVVLRQCSRNCLFPPYFL